MAGNRKQLIISNPNEIQQWCRKCRVLLKGLILHLSVLHLSINYHIRLVPKPEILRLLQKCKRFSQKCTNLNFLGRECAEIFVTAFTLKKHKMEVAIRRRYHVQLQCRIV